MTAKKVEQLQNNMLYTALILGVLIVISLGYNVKISNQLEGFSVGEVKAVAPSPSAAPSPTEAPTVDVSADDDPVLGSADAPVTIIEFSDFQCPFCKRFADQAWPQIYEEYIKTGKVKVVFRDFPLGFHDKAQKAHEATECADDQGKFWEMHDLMFANQASISEDNYKKWAGDLGLDTTEFASCLDSGKHAQEVKDDFADGQAAGVSGTPSFFINGKKLVGAHPFATFKQVIDAELQ